MHGPNSGGAPTLPEPSPAFNRTLPMVIATALFMENMDGTILSTALPAIARSLGENPLSLKLALTAYMVSLAIFIPISGWLADRYGARRVFASAIVVFLLGSVACAFAGSLEGFVLARALQGAGGAMMVPVGRLIVVRGTPKAQLVQAMTWLSVPALTGPVAGPLVGGFIVTHFDWRWIFFVNIPIGILGIVLGLRLIPDSDPRSDRPLDRSGFVLSAVALSSLMFGSAAAERFGVANLSVIGGFVLGLSFCWLTWRHSQQSAAPLLDLELMRLQTYRVVVAGGSLFRIGVGAVPFLLPLMLQLGFGLDPLHSGMLTFIAAVGALFMKTFTTRLLRRFGFRRMLTINSVFAAMSLAAIGFFTPQTPHFIIYIVLFIGGCMRSVQFTSMNALMFADVDKARMSNATSLAAVAQQVSLSLGVTLGAAALDASMAYSGHGSIQASDFQIGFFAVGLVMLLATPSFFALKDDAGAEISGAKTAAPVTAEQR